MNKNEKAAVAAVIAYLQLENEADVFMKMKKNAYGDFFSVSNDNWQKSGVSNIMTGRKILDAKRKIKFLR